MKLTMVGRLSECVLLAYRTPAESVRHLLPPPIELVTREGLAFWNVVACRVEKMRQIGLPKFVGISYHHVAYRLYVRAATADGRCADGLFFVRSEVDSAPVAWGGNVFTDFRFNRARIELETSPAHVELRVSSGIGQTLLRAREADDASRDEPDFLKYRPLALSCDRHARRLKLARVVRDESAWHESPLDVTEARWPLFERLGQTDLVLESATRVAPLDYRWELGETLPLVAPPARGSTSPPASASFPGSCSTTSGRG